MASLCLGLAAAQPASADELSRAEIHELEQLLVRLGFDPGLVDGVADARTAAAIEAYQDFAALRVDGVASPALLEELRGVAQSLGVAVKSTPSEAVPPSAVTATDDVGPRTSESSDSETPPPAGEVTGAPWDTAVHLASFKQEAKAHTEWQRLQQRLPNLFGDMDSRISAFDLGEEGLFFRLYAGPFPNLATAQDFCVTVNLEGFHCGVARGGAPQIAATGPATPETVTEPEAQEPQAETEAAAETETAAESEEPPSTEPAAAGAAAATVASDAPETPPSLEESPAAEPPVAAETPETQGTAALAPLPEVDVGSSPPAPVLAESAEETQSSAVTAAPTVLATAEQITAATTETAPQEAPEDTAEDVTGDSAEDPADVGQSETAAGAPTLLIATAQFAEATTDPSPGGAAEDRPGESAIGGPTLLATMFDFGDEEEEPSAQPEPEPAGAPAAAASEAGEAATGETPGWENGETGAAEPGSETEEVAATRPAETTEPEATQAAAVAETGVEDYMKATTAFQIGDCATALHHYGQAFEKGGLPREAQVSGHNNRGRCLYNRGQFDEALAEFDQAIGLDRDFAAAYYHRGRVHNAMGHSAEARADLKSAYDLGFGRLKVQE